MFSAVDTIWVLLGTVLIFFMQAGFAMLETGFTRAKNAGNIIMKNLMDFAIGTVVFWIIGFGIMFAGSGKFIGGLDLFIQGNYDSTIPTPAFIIFQTVFCATAATIVSGAMAERTKFVSYCIYSLIISMIIYPISGHWIWGGGWLSDIGFHDFAGSTAVHMVGGTAALVGAKIVGPRIGKYKDGKPNAIPGHNLTIGALGVFILWFCWFGFNGGSTASMTGDDTIFSAGSIFVTTNLAAATATVVTMLVTWIRYGKPDVSMTLNGSLAGLVAITAGCDLVSPVGAFFIGLIAAFVVVFGIEFIDKVLKIDDPVGAIGVHGFCGAAGTILTGLFAQEGGLFYGGGVHFLLIQILGVIAVAAWVAVTMSIVFFAIKKTIGLRVSEEEETRGLDLTEHALPSSYADFMPLTSLTSATPAPQASVISDIPVVTTEEHNGKKITKITTIINQNRFDTLKLALQAIGIQGMTVTQVLGFGTQRGDKNFYRGVAIGPAQLLPKLQVEIVISEVPVEIALDTIKKAVYTGNIGDGKIFVYDVENVVKIRTGEEGYDALQGDE